MAPWEFSHSGWKNKPDSTFAESQQHITLELISLFVYLLKTQCIASYIDRYPLYLKSFFAKLFLKERDNWKSRPIPTHTRAYIYSSKLDWIAFGKMENRKSTFFSRALLDLRFFHFFLSFILFPMTTSSPRRIGLEGLKDARLMGIRVAVRRMRIRGTSFYRRLGCTLSHSCLMLLP